MFFVVERRSGPEWDASRPLEEQSGWDAHADFMDGLANSGFVVLGGPLAEPDLTTQLFVGLKTWPVGAPPGMETTSPWGGSAPPSSAPL